MFAVAITNQPLKVSEKGINMKEFEQKDRVVTVYTDDLFTDCVDGSVISEYKQ